MARRSPGGLTVAVMFASTVFCMTVLPTYAVEIADLKAEVERIRKEIATQDDPKLNPVSDVDQTVLLDKYADDQKITTKNGRLTVGGLVHIWYQYIQNDRKGIISPATNNVLANPEPNNKLDNDTFRIRRTELRFGMDITDNIFAYIMIDPSREANVTFTPAPTFSNHNSVINNPNLAAGRGQQSLSGQTIFPQLLQDAFIDVHDVVPHHDFRFGQFKPPSGEEASMSSGKLDFVDRAMVTAISNVRDVGMMVHGGWFYSEKNDIDSGRLQYWAGVFNGPDGTVLTDPEIVEGGNRSDDNNDKDFCWRLTGRPVWDDKAWYGRLEMGYARTDGHRGQSGQGFDPARAINSLNRERTAIFRQAAYLWYRPNGIVQGMWLRGEWGALHDRYSARFPTTLLGVGQLAPGPVTAQGWFASTGYKVSESPYAECLNKGSRWCKAIAKMEMAVRYEKYDNIATENVVSPDRRTDLFMTTVTTVGFNYYINKYNSRVQANYMWVQDPVEPSRGLREVKNNMFVMSFQMMF